MTNAGQCPLYGALLIRYWRTHTHSTFEFGAGVVSQVAVVHCIHFDVCVCVHSLARLPLYVRRKGVPNERTNERTNKHTFTHNTTYKRTSPNKWRGRHSHALILFSFSFVVQYSMLLADRVRPIGRTIDRCSIHVFSLHRRAHFRLLPFVRSFFWFWSIFFYQMAKNGRARGHPIVPNCTNGCVCVCVCVARPK